MTAATTLLGALTDDPTSTSELYDRVGYPALVRAGLVPYEAFRAELVKLSAAGLAERGTDDDGATTWRRPAPADAEPDAGAAPEPGPPGG
jgi:hypothetical protein